MSNFHSFSDKAVQEAVDSANQHYTALNAANAAKDLATENGHLLTLAECISVTVSDGKVCLNLPLGFGKVCIPIPISFDAKVAQACLHICTTWGIPTGIKVTISIGGTVIVTKSFGKC